VDKCEALAKANLVGKKTGYPQLWIRMDDGNLEGQTS
jgi:hypothetical protein